MDFSVVSCSDVSYKKLKVVEFFIDGTENTIMQRCPLQKVDIERNFGRGGVAIASIILMFPVQPL